MRPAASLLLLAAAAHATLPPTAPPFVHPRGQLADRGVTGAFRSIEDYGARAGDGGDAAAPARRCDGPSEFGARLVTESVVPGRAHGRDLSGGARARLVRAAEGEAAPSGDCHRGGRAPLHGTPVVSRDQACDGVCPAPRTWCSGAAALCGSQGCGGIARNDGTAAPRGDVVREPLRRHGRGTEVRPGRLRKKRSDETAPPAS